MTEVISHVALRFPVEEGGSWRRPGSCTHMSELFADRHTASINAIISVHAEVGETCEASTGKEKHRLQIQLNFLKWF